MSEWDSIIAEIQRRAEKEPGGDFTVTISREDYERAAAVPPPVAQPQEPLTDEAICELARKHADPRYVVDDVHFTPLGMLEFARALIHRAAVAQEARDAALEALRELVALKSMKDLGFPDDELRATYEARKPIAWANARAALKEQP